MNDGTLFSPVPAGNWTEELPAQMLASIGPYGFWYYYMHTGDIATMEYVYPAIKRYLSLWSLDDNDLTIERSGGYRCRHASSSCMLALYGLASCN